MNFITVAATALSLINVIDELFKAANALADTVEAEAPAIKAELQILAAQGSALVQAIRGAVHPGL